MRIALYNPVAGQSWFGGRIRRACRHLERMGDVRLVPTTVGNIGQQTRALLSPDVSAVLACGGDGTVSDVASGLIGTEIPLCIIPCGTTNVLAREFGMPMDPVRAIDVVSQSSSFRLLRAWEIGDRHLILGAGAGWDARLMHRIPPRLKRALGPLAIGPIAMHLARTYDFPAMTVVGTDARGNGVSASGTSVIISNCRRWTGDNTAFPMANPADDLLEVVVLQEAKLSHLLRFWVRVVLPGGRPLDIEGVRLLQLRDVSVTSTVTPPPEVHINGDPAGRLPIHVVPAGALRVCV